MASDPLFPPLVRKAIIDSILKDSAATEVTKKLFCKPLMCMGARTDRRMGYQAPGVQAMGHGSRALHGIFRVPLTLHAILSMCATRVGHCSDVICLVLRSVPGRGERADGDL